MIYKALYRKYRPFNFNDMYGQEVPIQILKNAIKKNKISHAYLFAGPRGTGKTSLAKILARTINCESLNEEVIPCGTCDSCKMSTSTECVDIIEIDAASNNGVDEIRELKTKISLVPTFLKYKVYIIDEVHMLSPGAFNALLKTLEEPPTNTLFVLATTELLKVPATILSRCQVLEFKKIDDNNMYERLSEISSKEGITIDEDAIREIIKNSDGCLRDAVNLLDKVSSYSIEKIKNDDVRSVCGNISCEEICNYVDLINNHKILEFNHEIELKYNDGKNIFSIIDDIILELKRRMITEKANILNICSIIKKIINIQSDIKQTTTNQLILLQAELILTFTSIEKGTGVSEITSKRQEKEVEIIPETNSKLNVSVEKVDNSQETERPEVINEPKKIENIDFSDFKKIRINNTFVAADKKKLQNIKNKWQELVNNAFDKEYGAYICMLIDSMPVAASDKYVILTCKYDSLVEKSNATVEKIEKAYNYVFKENLNFVFLTSSEWKESVQDYVNKLKNNYKYIYLDEPSEVKPKENLKVKKNEQKEDKKNKVTELFGNDLVEIK